MKISSFTKEFTTKYKELKDNHYLNLSKRSLINFSKQQEITISSKQDQSIKSKHTKKPKHCIERVFAKLTFIIYIILKNVIQTISRIYNYDNKL